jgi:hypothetical protein
VAGVNVTRPQDSIHVACGAHAGAKARGSPVTFPGRQDRHPAPATLTQLAGAGADLAVAALTKSHLDTSYVQVPVQALQNGQAYNPVYDQVLMAFMTAWKLPGIGDWNPGSWTESTAPGIYLAQCLVGPAAGGVNLPVGVYDVWVQIIDNPEIPVINAGTLAII